MKNTDIRKTKVYYSEIAEEDLCNCDYCKNYYLQIKKEYPEITEYLAAFGIDIEKPFELISLEPDENGILEYCACQYIVIGTCDSYFEHTIGSVNIGIAQAHPSTNIQEFHFVIEIYPIFLKWIFP